MKKHILFTFISLFLFAFSSCETQPETPCKTCPPSDEHTYTEDVEWDNTVSCIYDVYLTEDESDEIYEDHCEFRNYKAHLLGVPDEEGRHYFTYKLYRKSSNGEYESITNEEMFNDRKDELLSLLNKKFESDYQKYSQDAHYGDCFTQAFTPFNWNDVGIEFDYRTINFHGKFTDDAACFSLHESVVKINIEDVIEFVK